LAFLSEFFRRVSICGRAARLILNGSLRGGGKSPGNGSSQQCGASQCGTKPVTANQRQQNRPKAWFFSRINSNLFTLFLGSVNYA